MGNFKDLQGLRFGRLEVIRRDGTAANGSALWLCRCDCGNYKTARGSHLVGGYIQSCGCLHAERSEENCRNRTTHGAKKRSGDKYARLYSVWRNMKDRCLNPGCHAFSNYGGRGITICSEWENSFEVFKEWALKAGYSPEAEYGKCTLDRINNNKGYSPDNCRWVDMKTQANNRRNGRDKNGRYTRREVITCP